MRGLALALALAACSGKPEIPILVYHSVGTASDEYTTPVAQFAAQLDWLAENGFHTVSLRDLAEARARRRPLPDKSVILTFDDGREDGFRIVLPALTAHGFRATFFVVTGEVGQPGYLTWEQVRALAAAGMEIGSHSATHARLSDLDDARVREELTRSRAELEQRLGRPVDLVAYPYNSVRRRIVRIARESGYDVGVAGLVHGGRDLLNLLRLPVNGMTSLDAFARMVSR